MDLKRSDKIFLGSVLMGALLIVCWVYQTNASLMSPHIEEYNISTYDWSYDVATNVSITRIRTVSGVTVRYAGHHDFEIGHLQEMPGDFCALPQMYKIHSEGEPGWLYRKITSFEILDQDTT